MAKLNERLKLLRESWNMSQAEFAKKIGLSKSSINMYERGEREPSIETMEAMADFFNVDMDFLVGKSEHKNKSEWLKTIGYTIKTIPKQDIHSVSNNILCTPHEQKVIIHYRAKPEMQPAVDTLLGISDNESKNTPAPQKHYPNIAAESGSEIKAKPLDIDTMIEIDKMK